MRVNGVNNGESKCLSTLDTCNSIFACINILENLLHVTLKRQAEISADIFARLFAVFQLFLHES